MEDPDNADAEQHREFDEDGMSSDHETELKSGLLANVTASGDDAVCPDSMKCPAGHELWEEHKNKLQDSCKDVGDNHVIEMVTLTRKQIGSSWKIETAGLEQALAILEQKGSKRVSTRQTKITQQRAVEGATTIVQAAVFSAAQLKDYCRETGLHMTGSKLRLVQRVSVHLKRPEPCASTEI
ncbi:hypothetical protein R1sor_011056 [Riccia sorocarpa]|uniref:SAP domain-containing protein n=1 Tax=Riccia sorocarpa TaxID=122646 RepID=A0ABD3I3N6_9MARC